MEHDPNSPSAIIAAATGTVLLVSYFLSKIPDKEDRQQNRERRRARREEKRLAREAKRARRSNP